MQANRLNRTGSSWQAVGGILFLCFLSMMFLPGATGVATAKTTLTVKLAKLPSSTNPALISVRAVEAETGRFLGSASLNRQSTQVQVKVEAVPQIIFADLLTSDGNTLSGHSAVLRPVDRKKMTVTLQLKSTTSSASSEMTDLSGGLFSPSGGAAWPPADIGLVGGPPSGFTVDGFDFPSKGLANMVTTDVTKAPCYNAAGGFVVIETDPNRLAERQAEIDFSNSSWADPSTRLQDLYVPPTYLIKGSLVSDGTTATITYRLVDSQGNELLSRGDTGSVDNIFGISSSVAKELADAMCCKSKKVKCAKTGSIDIDVDYDILNPACPIDHQSVQGNIKFSLLPMVTDPQNVCEYVGNGASYFKSDAECVNGAFQHTTCTISENILGKVPKPAFPFCDALVVDFTEVWDCIEVDPLGTHSSSLPLEWTETFQYRNGNVVDYPVTSQVVGHSRIILHLK